MWSSKTFDGCFERAGMVTRWRARPRFFQSVQERAVWDKEEFETYFMAHGDMFDYQDTEDGGKVRSRA